MRKIIHTYHIIFFSNRKEEKLTKIEKYLKFPVFIKPSNSGSSVGVNKATTKEEVINTDLKTFTSDNTKFAVAQVFTLDIDEIKNDMHNDVPMERLLCGDVGFGNYSNRDFLCIVPKIHHKRCCCRRRKRMIQQFLEEI